MVAMPGVRGRWQGMAYVAAAALPLSSAGLFIKVLNLGAVAACVGGMALFFAGHLGSS